MTRAAAAAALLLLACACQSGAAARTEPPPHDAGSLLASVERRLYRPAWEGLADLRAHFDLVIAAEGDEPGTAVRVGGELLWKAPGRMRVRVDAGPEHAAEAQRTIEDGYARMLDGSMLTVALELIQSAESRLIAPDRLLVIPPPDSTNAALGFCSVERVLFTIGKSGLPSRIDVTGQLDDQARARGWPTEHHMEFSYRPLGGRFLIASVIETSPYAETEFRADFADQDGITVPSAVEILVRQPEQRAPTWRGRIAISLSRIAVNAGIADRELDGAG